jgi:hypothetical protein
VSEVQTSTKEINGLARPCEGRDAPPCATGIVAQWRNERGTDIYKCKKMVRAGFCGSAASASFAAQPPRSGAAFDLAGDVADDAAEIGSERPQGSVGAL